MATSDLLSALRVLGVLRAASHTETLAAANIAAGQDTGRTIKVTPLVGAHGDEYVVVTRISAQGIKPSNLQITARDLNRHSFTLHLTPALEVDGLPLIGNATEGVELTVRNSAARTVDLLIHVAVLNRAQLLSALAPAMQVLERAAGPPNGR